MPNKKESQNIEWKQRRQDDHLKSICGFANAQGGRIYIGKDNKGRIVGLKNSQKLLAELPNKIRSHLGLMPGGVVSRPAAPVAGSGREPVTYERAAEYRLRRRDFYHDSKVQSKPVSETRRVEA